MAPADTDAPVDGRVARRQRNIDAVIDVVLEMFAEDALFPSIEQVATRSGLSLRSLYRYFADPGELLEAVAHRSFAVGRELADLPAIGEGPLVARIEDFVAVRVLLHERFGPVFRATAANAAKAPRLAEELTRTRHALQVQFEQQFAPELQALKPTDRATVAAAGDVATQFDAVSFLRRHRELSEAQTRAVLSATLSGLLGR
jgi:AcrR family transcriptional regulator